MLYVCLLLSELRIVDYVQFSAYFCLQLNEGNGVLCWHSVQRLDASEEEKITV